MQKKKIPVIVKKGFGCLDKPFIASIKTVMRRRHTDIELKWIKKLEKALETSGNHFSDVAHSLNTCP